MVRIARPFCSDSASLLLYAANMEVRFKPETESRLSELASKGGHPTDDLVEDCFGRLCDGSGRSVAMLDDRYDEVKSRRVKPLDGETFFESLRQREDELLQQRDRK
jgi:hypothetical protein